MALTSEEFFKRLKDGKYGSAAGAKKSVGRFRDVWDPEAVNKADKAIAKAFPEDVATEAVAEKAAAPKAARISKPPKRAAKLSTSQPAEAAALKAPRGRPRKQEQVAVHETTTGVWELDASDMQSEDTETLRTIERVHTAQTSILVALTQAQNAFGTLGGADVDAILKNGVEVLGACTQGLQRIIAGTAKEVAEVQSTLPALSVAPKGFSTLPALSADKATNGVSTLPKLSAASSET